MRRTYSLTFFLILGAAFLLLFFSVKTRTDKDGASLSLLGLREPSRIYLKGGYASQPEYPVNSDSLSYAAGRFRFLYDEYLSDCRIYYCVIPDKNYFMAEECGQPHMDYDAFFAQMRKEMDFASEIVIADRLRLSDYYRTDAHWRQENLPEIAGYIAGQMGVTLTEEYELTAADVSFYGSFASKTILPVPADDLYYLDSERLRRCRVYDYETDSVIPVYDLEKRNGRDPYELFLSGAKSLLIIENPDAATDRELVLFRDSFGSSIAPLLSEGYAKITLADIRYISPRMLEPYLPKNADVLFLYSTSVLNNSITMK